MLSDAPNASWHPAFMPNSTSGLSRSLSKDVPAFPGHHGDAVDDAVSVTGTDAGEAIHNQSIATDSWFPDYGTGDGWVDDASKAHAAAEPSPADAIANGVSEFEPEPTSNASKHFSTMSFTRTVSHEVNWNDDDDPEWNLPRTSTDPFKFMPPNERTNSFPIVSPAEQLEQAELAQPLPTQAETVLHEADEDDEHMAPGGLNADPEAFGASFDEDVESADFFQQAVGGEVSGTAEEAEEARFVEGVPLIPTTEEVAPPKTEQVTADLFGAEDAGEEDDFFNHVQADAQPQTFSPLERKSTMQVLGALDVGARALSFEPLEGTAEEETNDVTQPMPEDEGLGTQENAAHVTPEKLQQEPAEDLDAKWKAMFGDEEDDGFLLDDDAETKDVDPAGFLGSDDEGFLDDDELPNATEPVAAPALPLTPTEAKPVNGRYLPSNSAPPAPAAPPANPYLPAAPVLAATTGSSYLPEAPSPALQPPVASPYAVPTPAPSAPPRYGAALPPPTQEQNKPQSFVGKAKGGYTSPYDLPMEVVKPKLRPPAQHPLRSSSTPNAPPLGPPAIPRSTSLNPPTGPPKPLPSKPPIAEKFFEDLPMVAKPPRSSSRQSTHSVPSPTQAGPYPPPPPQNAYAQLPQSAPPVLAQAVPPQAAVPPPQPIADIPRLVAPPPVNPYAQLQAGPGSGTVVPPAAPSRYSPSLSSAPPVNGQVPVPAPSRYSPAPPAARQPSVGYATNPSASAPPILPHQPRTSSPLAHFEITHERSRAHGIHHAEGGTLAEKRSVSSVYNAHLQRVPSLPPTTEVEEDESRAPVQTPTGYVPTPPSTSPESRYSQLPHRPRQTPPPSSHPPQSMLSPPKRATSSHGLVTGQHEFAPPQRSQTQSPGKLYGPRNGKPVEPIPRPSSVSDPSSPRNVPPPSAYTPAVGVPVAASTRPRGVSQNLNLVAPTDGRERDPLQRWKGAPLLSWGVGGTIVTMFPKDVPRYGMNNNMPTVVRSPGEVKVQSVKDIQPLEERLTKFPGPLKGKSKKKETIAWLTAGIESLEREQPHNLYSQLHLSHDDKRLGERVLLWKILRVFVEYDGTLEGNPAVEKTVRQILSPQLETAEGAPTYITGADAGRLGESPVTRMQSDMVDSSTVEQIRKHLLDGDSEKAIWAAADVRLWGHALLLANALAPSLYKQVAQEFIKKEVNFSGHNNESLAALYGVLSGNHDESVDELVPVHARAGLQLVAKDTSSGPSKDAMEGLDKWRETLTLILSNRSPGDAQAIKSLGNLLAGYGRAEAAHTCFMFARSHAIFGGFDDPNANFVLVGSDHKRQAEQFAKEIEPLLLSEVYEYGQSLASGSNIVLTSPHLAAYKLQHAYALAEYGYRDKALQYCEAISAAITAQTKRSPYHHALLETAVEDLMKRLRQAPKEESNSWITKPSMNKVSDSVWNRFNKFVAGDDSENAGQGQTNEGEASGPFARVAGGTPTISRPPSANGLETFGATVPNYGMPPPLANGPIASSAPPTRAASRYAPAPAHPVAHTNNPYEPGSPYAPRSSMERTSGEYTRTSSDLRRQSSESQRGAHSIYNPNQAPSPTTGYMPYGSGPAPIPEKPAASAPPAQPATSGYQPYGYSAPLVNDAPSEPAPASEAVNGSSGYQPPSYGYEPPSFTPYEVPAEKENGVPEGEPQLNSYEPPSYQPYSYEAPSYEPDSQPTDENGSDEDSKPKPKKKGVMYDDDDDIPMPAVKSSSEKTKEEKDRENAEMFRKAAEEDAKRAAEAKQAKKGWGFTGWFGGGAKKESIDASTPGKPIRAKLGDSKMSFYYDPEQKRWVNKNGDSKDNEAKKATPPPPKAAPRSVSSSPALPMGGPPVPTSNPDPGRASAPPMGPPRSTMTPPPGGLSPSLDVNSLGPPAMMRSVSNTSAASAASAPSRPTTSLSNSSSIDDLLSAAGPRKGAKKPRKSARYVDVMTKE
ncbi:Sec23-binding domain of Sec16-domain-containing protein [Immersiella caudata]|uniref:Protein transport protein sec16 n=1 Tax=Immersiella caudata TaxID=314043 RepID=A0AA39X3E2_9PEZI|nr:Sec23-binding domain of Sec16-domain-containing protein [Immersiella caudata]